MILPIMQLHGRTKATAGQISDASLLDVLVGVGNETIYHGVIVDVSAVAGDDFKFNAFNTGASAKDAKRPAFVARSHCEVDENRNGRVMSGKPANLVESGRVLVLVKDGVTINASGAVEVADPAATGSLKGIKGTVTNGTTNNKVRVMMFTGRVDKYPVDASTHIPVYITVAEVQI